jgi:hypothetical protein
MVFSRKDKDDDYRPGNCEWAIAQSSKSPARPGGASFAFTSYLSAVSPEWKSSVGIGTKVNWPAGVDARGSDGVATTVNITRGAIAYVESRESV